MLYDGHCRFCTAWAERLRGISRGRIATLSFQEPGVLDRFPGLTHDACMQELKLVEGEGRVFGGAEAVTRALSLGRPVLGRLLLAYYLPGVRRVADRAYAAFARRRYRWFGKPEACDVACSIEGRR